MKNNLHILTANDLIGTIKIMVQNLPHCAETEIIMQNLTELSDELFSIHSDYELARRTIYDLNKKLFEPEIYAQSVSHPVEGDYNAVREYVEKRKQIDTVFKQYCNSHTRAQLCERLSEEFGWSIDKKSYARNVQRH